MKTKLALVTATGAFLLCGALYSQQPNTAKAITSQEVGSPSKLGTLANLRKYNVTIRRFDPKKGLESGEEFVLPVDSPDEEHAISSTLSNAVSFTKKSQGSEGSSFGVRLRLLTERGRGRVAGWGGLRI